MSVLCCKWTAHNPLFMDLIWLVINACRVREASSPWWWAHGASNFWQAEPPPPACALKSPLIPPDFKEVLVLTFQSEIQPPVFSWKDQRQLSELQPSACAQR